MDVLADVLARLTEIPAPMLGLDMDGVLDENPIFFGILTRVWPGKVVIVTYRDDRAKVEADLEELGIQYDELVVVNSFEAKAEVIVEMGVMVYVDDQPEMLKNIPPTVTVLLMRNEGNFYYHEKLWMLSRRTGRLI